MTPAEMRALYAEQIGAFGEVITLRRQSVPDLEVRARVTGYKPDELGGGVQQGDRKVIILADDITFDPPLRPGDRIVLRGRVLAVAVVDDSTRRVAGELIAYEVAARG